MDAGAAGLRRDCTQEAPACQRIERDHHLSDFLRGAPRLPGARLHLAHNAWRPNRPLSFAAVSRVVQRGPEIGRIGPCSFWRPGQAEAQLRGRPRRALVQGRQAKPPIQRPAHGRPAAPTPHGAGNTSKNPLYNRCRGKYPRSWLRFSARTETGAGPGRQFATSRLGLDPMRDRHRTALPSVRSGTFAIGPRLSHAGGKQRERAGFS